MKRAKIVCTIGPVTASRKNVDALIRTGTDVARLNFSHGTHEEHNTYAKFIRDISRKLRKPIAILQDLQGIKIRIGNVQNGSVRLRRGQKVLLKPGNDVTTEEVLFISYPALLKDLKKRHRVFLDDGLLELRVTGKKRDAAEATVREGGVLTAHKGVNLPDSKISLTPFTDKDKDDLDFGIKIDVDAVALSFVLRTEDITVVKNRLKDNGKSIPVIAKIEKPEALKNIDSILDAADGIMVARGDLGVEMPPDEIPLIQKSLIKKANEKRKIVITATQMLESMREHIRPTRAEITDVANAVIDGTDALMLSAETSTGKYPLEAVKMMRKIIETTERKGEHSKTVPHVFAGKRSMEDLSSYAVTISAVRAAEDVDARCIVAFTRSGFTALLVSKCRPMVPVIAFTPDEAVMRRMPFYWGITPLYMRPLSSTDEMIFEVEKKLIDLRLAKKGEMIVIIASSPLNTYGRTNFMKIHRIL
jgi:pyruvate kinase